MIYTIDGTRREVPSGAFVATIQRVLNLPQTGVWDRRSAQALKAYAQTNRPWYDEVRRYWNNDPLPLMDWEIMAPEFGAVTALYGAAIVEAALRGQTTPVSIYDIRILDNRGVPVAELAQQPAQNVPSPIAPQPSPQPTPTPALTLPTTPVQSTPVTPTPVKAVTPGSAVPTTPAPIKAGTTVVQESTATIPSIINPQPSGPPGWFWAGLGVVAVGGTAGAVYLATRKSSDSRSDDEEAPQRLSDTRLPVRADAREYSPPNFKPWQGEPASYTRGRR